MRRLSKVTERRTQLDWAIFVQDIAASYPEPERIALVMDNLNTHTPGSLHEAFAPQKARALWERFEFARTPKHGSWLNMAEIEINVMVSQCLDRRIDSIETVRSGVAAWQARRDNLQAKVNWQLTTRDARIKLKRLYPTNCLWGDTSGVLRNLCATVIRKFLPVFFDKAEQAHDHFSADRLELTVW